MLITITFSTCNIFHQAETEIYQMVLFNLTLISKQTNREHALVSNTRYDYFFSESDHLAHYIFHKPTLMILEGSCASLTINV